MLDTERNRHAKR